MWPRSIQYFNNYWPFINTNSNNRQWVIGQTQAASTGASEPHWYLGCWFPTHSILLGDTGGAWQPWFNHQSSIFWIPLRGGHKTCLWISSICLSRFWAKLQGVTYCSTLYIIYPEISIALIWLLLQCSVRMKAQLRSVASLTAHKAIRVKR